MRGLGSYRHFGLRAKWLEEFFNDPKEWWSRNSLGPVQFTAMRLYLKDLEIINEKEELTEIGKVLRSCGAYNQTTWLFIWSQLFWKSLIFNTYSKLPWGKMYSRDDIVNIFMNLKYSMNSATNGFLSLVETLKHSPLRDMGIGKPVLVGRKVIAIEKMGLVLDEEYVRRAVVISAHNALKFGKSVDLKTLKFEGSPMEVFGIGEYETLGIISRLGEIRRIEEYLKEWCS